MKAQGTNLKDARIVFFGAGSSAVGVAKSIASYIELKGNLSAEQARKVRTWTAICPILHNWVCRRWLTE